jgi:hypothetical protein
MSTDSVAGLLDHPIVKVLFYSLMSGLVWYSNQQLNRLDHIASKINATEISVLVANGRLDRFGDRLERAESDISRLWRSRASHIGDPNFLPMPASPRPGGLPTVTRRSDILTKPLIVQ